LAENYNHGDHGSLSVFIGQAIFIFLATPQPPPVLSHKLQRFCTVVFNTVLVELLAFGELTWFVISAYFLEDILSSNWKDT